MNNFKVTFTAALLFATILSAKAQTKAPLEFGIKAGVSSGSTGNGFKLFTDESSKIGFNVGAFLRTGGRLYFQPEVNLVAFTSEVKFSSIKFDQKSRQLNIPLMVGYKLLDKENLNVRLSAGPDLNYNLKKGEAHKNFGSKRTSVGGVINAGADFRKFTLDARYSHGLTSLYKQEKQKLKVYSVSLGYKF